MSMDLVTETTEGQDNGANKKSGSTAGSKHHDPIGDRLTEKSRQYVTFYLGDYFLGVAVEKVQEVFQAKEMTRVPLASSEIAGLINLRGHIIVTVDLRKRLGFKIDGAQTEVMSIVVRTDDAQVNLLVDRIGGVIEVHPDAFEETPSTLDKRLKRVIRGIYKLKDHLLLALDTDLISTSDNDNPL